MSDEKKFEKECAVLNEIKSETAKVIVGQEMMIDRLLTALICGGHVLLEGVPGLAKTLTVSVLSQVIDADFKRIQFTLQSAKRCIYDKERSGFCQHRFGGRNQPRSGEGSIGSVGMHAGAAGNARR